MNKLLLIFLFSLFSLFIFYLIWYLITASSFKNNISSRVLNYYKQVVNTYNIQQPRESFDSNLLYLKALKEFSKTDYSNEGFCLKDFYIPGSSNSLVFDKHYNSFVSLTVVETILKLGARSLELNIFNSSYNKNNNGIPVGASYNTKLSYYKNNIATFNYIALNNICQVIKANAFINSINDPLFLILNLNFSSNPNLCNQIARILYDNFKSNLLDCYYSYQRQALGDIPINKLKNKIIIICSKGFKSTDLDELVNGSWEEVGSSPESQGNQLISKQYFGEINSTTGLGAKEIISTNKQNMSIQFPDVNKKNHKILSYNPNLCFQLGISIIHMPYLTLLDSNGKVFLQDTQYGSFKKYSLILKPKNLRAVQKYITYDTSVPEDWNPELRKIKLADDSFGVGIEGF